MRSHSVIAVLVAAQPLWAAIEVRAGFEGGNIGQVTTVSPEHLRCAVQGQADHDGRNRQANWYYFELTGLPRKPVAIELVGLAGEYDYRAPAYAVTKGTRPVYSYDGKQWKHFTDEQVSYGGGEPSLTMRFTPEQDHMWIAHVPPYTNRDLAALLASVGKSPFLEQRSVGRTVEGREMPLLSITDPKTAATSKRVLWLMFRQHAWETGSSWAGEGAIRYLLSDAASALRTQTIVKIFPMADPDGVATGRVRYNKNGYDLNRNWDTSDPRLTPEIASQRQAVLDWMDSGHRVDLFLSLHNTESGEYLQAPAEFRDLGQRALDLLKAETTFNPTTPLRDFGPPPDKGRMTVAHGLFHDRKIPAMLMEQMVEFNSKLGRCPTAADRMKFGAGLVRALAEAVGARP